MRLSHPLPFISDTLLYFVISLQRPEHSGRFFAFATTVYIGLKINASMYERVPKKENETELEDVPRAGKQDVIQLSASQETASGFVFGCVQGDLHTKGNTRYRVQSFECFPLFWRVRAMPVCLYRSY